MTNLITSIRTINARRQRAVAKAFAAGQRIFYLYRAGEPDLHVDILKIQSNRAVCCNVQGAPNMRTIPTCNINLVPSPAVTTRYEMCPDCEASFRLATNEALPEHKFLGERCAMSGQLPR